MKSKFSKILLFLMLLLIVFALTACGNVVLTDLPAPSGLTVIDNVLHWNSVSGANAYIVNCDGTDVATVSDLQYTLTGLTEGRTYTFKVKAKHTLGAYNDSPYSDTYSYQYVGGNSTPRLLAPANVNINDGVITWDAVENAQGYVVWINGTEYTAEQNQFTAPTLEDGAYNIKVKAVGDGETHLTSQYSNDMPINLHEGSVCTNEQFGQFDDLNQFESFLGYGFDVVADSVVSDRTVLTSFPIFNIDELMNLRFLKVNSKSSQVKVISEDNIESFSEQWNAALNVNVSISFEYAPIKVGGSVKLKNEYATASNSAKSAYYYCITITDQKFYIVMQGDMDTYRDMLSTGFEKDLYDKNVDPAVLFQRYGTHFITSAVMGGRMNAFYNMYSLEESVTAKEYSEVSAAISVSFNEMFSVGVDAAVSFNQTIETAKTKTKVNTKESIDVMGGADFGIASVSQVPTIYADWQKSLDEHPSLMGIKDASSLIGIWELIDVERDTDNDWTWIDQDGVEQHGTRAQQLQAYFYKYGLENYNQLMSASHLPETVKPEAIGNVLVNGEGADRDGYYSVDTDSVNTVSFAVLPDNAVGYTKSYSLDEESKKYAYIENGELVVRPAADIPSGTVLYLTISAGNVQKRLRLRVIRKYNVSYNLNFTTDYVIPDTRGVLEGSAISQPVLMSKKDGSEIDVAIERFGYRLTGWAVYTNGEYIPYDFTKPVSSNLNLFAQWQKITNVVTFDAQNGNFENGQTVLTEIVDYNQLVQCPEYAPNRDHYEFAGWFTEKNGIVPFDFENTPILKKTTVYAKWTPIRYTITVNYNNGNAVEKFYTSAEDGFTISLSNPTKKNYDFVCWELPDGTEIDNGYLFKQDVTIKAVYTPTLYIVTFNTDGGTVIEPQSVSVETNFMLSQQVPAPQKEGHTFKTWRVFVNNNYEEMVDIRNLTITANTTITALYDVNKYSVTFDSNGGSVVSPYQNVSYGSTITEPSVPQREGYNFVGWFKDSSLEKRFSFEADAIKGETTLYALWTKNELFSVTFFTNVPNKTFEPITVENNAVLSSRYTEDMNSDVAGYRFDGWFTDEDFNNFFNPSTPITQNLVLYAKWIPLSYNLEFVDGNNVLETKVYAYNEEITVPESPVKEGYTFVGWSQEIPQRMPAGDLCIYANFEINSYSVLYLLSENGEVFKEKSFVFGEEINFAIFDPEKTGFEFDGWDRSLPATMPAHDVVITAKWIVKNYMLTFYLTSSADIYSEKHAEIEVEYGTVLADVTVSEPPAKVGYNFSGWDFGGVTTMPAESIDAHAIFTPITVDITLRYGDKHKTVEGVYGTKLSDILAQVELKDGVNLYDGTWHTDNGATVMPDATVPHTDTTYTANYCVRETTYSHTGLSFGQSLSENSGSHTLWASDFPEYDRSVMLSACGIITLEIVFESSKEVTFEVLSDGERFNVTGTNNSYTVNVGYQDLIKGLQLNFAYKGFFVFGAISISNINIKATATDEYCVNLNGEFCRFETLDEVDSILYTTPSKSPTTITVETSPMTIKKTTDYTFVNWKVGNETVDVINQIMQLSVYFANTHYVKAMPNYSTVSKYSANNAKFTASYTSKITDDSKDAYVTFDVKSVKSMLSKYNLKLTKIDISVYINEVNDGWQEIFLTKGKRSNWSNNSHVFKNEDIIYQKTDVGTGPADTKDSGWFNASKDVGYTGANLPDYFYMYFGAHGNGEDDYNVSDISITLHFQSM